MAGVAIVVVITQMLLHLQHDVFRKGPGSNLTVPLQELNAVRILPGCLTRTCNLKNCLADPLDWDSVGKAV